MEAVYQKDKSDAVLQTYFDKLKYACQSVAKIRRVRDVIIVFVSELR